ncbi:MAG TPA: hypothetical protein VGR96_10935, partial [Acidobacteriaceae bacterium]|nr:hypothetical protein [Acidobacteriaceae bacterium]
MPTSVINQERDRGHSDPHSPAARSASEDAPSIPSTMLAAVYRGVNDVRVEAVPVPAIGPGEVLLRVHSCGICGTDLKKI